MWYSRILQQILQHGMESLNSQEGELRFSTLKTHHYASNERDISSTIYLKNENQEKMGFQSTH